MILFAFWIASVPGAFASSSVNVPLDHWSYEAFEKLAGFGLLFSDLKGTRPYTRMEAARLVLEALKQKEQLTKELSPLAQYFLGRLQREFSDELALFGNGDGSTAKSFIKPIEEIKLRYVYVDGKPRRFVGYPGSNDGIDASDGTPLIHNNEGVVYGEHHNFSAQISSSFKLFDIFSGYVEPIVVARQNKGDLQNFDKVDVDLLKGYAKISPGNVELEGGRDSLWWGQGRHGALLLTNNATPLDLIKLSNPTPTLLPWFLQYLGPFKYTVFASRLEEDRDHPHPWLGGFKLDFKPFPIFEMGVAGTILCGGEGVPFNIKDIFNFLSAGGNTKTDGLAALDFRLQLPFLRNAEIYAEYGGEDSGGALKVDGFIFDDIGYILGIYFPRVTDDGRLDFRFEYAHNAHVVDSTPGFWYGHGIYRSGYTHDGLIMGHHMDGDAIDYFARATYYLRNSILLGLDFDYMERGITLSPIQERNYQAATDVSFDVTNALTVKVRYGYEQVKNANLLDNDDRDNHIVMTELSWRF